MINFSYKGTGALVPITDMMNADEYKEVLKMKMILELRNVTFHNSAVFQQDLTPCRTAKTIKQFFLENEIICLG